MILFTLVDSITDDNFPSNMLGLDAHLRICWEEGRDQTYEIDYDKANSPIDYEKVSFSIGIDNSRMMEIG